MAVRTMLRQDIGAGSGAALVIGSQRELRQSRKRKRPAVVSDETLFARYVAFDCQTSFARLYKKYERKVLRRLSLSFQLSDADADDVSQEVWSAVHRFRHRFQPDRIFSRWLCAIVRRQAVSWKRKAAAQRARPSDEPAFDPASTKIDDAPEFFEVQKEQVAAISNAIDELPDILSKAVRQVCFFKLTHANAAFEAGVSETTHRARLTRAKKQLESLLAA